MNKYLKYSILLTLTLLITSGIVSALPIGLSPQARPYESNPTVASFFDVGAPLTSGIDAMKDGDLASTGDFFLGAPHVLRPNANGFRQAWTVAPVGLLHYFAVKEETSDADSTYLSAAATALLETEDLDDPPTSATGTITGVRVTAVARRTGGDDQIRLMLRLGTVETFSHTTGGIFPASGATAYTAYSFTVARPGGGSWSWADITSLQAGVQSIIVGSTFTAVRVTQLYVEVLGPTTGFFELSTFTNTPADPLFTSIAWVDFKLKYSVPAAPSDDTYKIEYTVDPSGVWTALEPDTSSVFDRDGASQIRPFVNIVEPNDGTWDWTDIGAFRLLITATQGGGAWDAVKIYIDEAWITIYDTAPPAASTAVSVQPSSVIGLGTGQEFFVDIYARQITGLWGYQFFLLYNTTVLTATQYMSYWPFLYPSPSWIDDTIGEVEVSYNSFDGDLVGFTGVDTPLARVYFIVDAPGQSVLDLPALATQFVELKYAGNPVPQRPPIYDGWFSSPRFMSHNGGLLPPGPFSPINTVWHELYPVYSNTWRLLSWTDNGDGYLSASDQIDMEIPGWLYWFHVDTVTTTIHFTFKPDVPPDEGPGKAEPETPMTELPPVEPDVFPVNSRWHMIYPTYSRTFTITSWTDQGDGNFSPSDQFDFAFDDEGGPGVGPNHWAHLDSISTDIIISQKGPPEPSIPEFPLGIGALMSLIALVPVIYVWRTRPKKKVP